MKKLFTLTLIATSLMFASCEKEEPLKKEDPKPIAPIIPIVTAPILTDVDLLGQWIKPNTFPKRYYKFTGGGRIYFDNDAGVYSIKNNTLKIFINIQYLGALMDYTYDSCYISNDTLYGISIIGNQFTTICYK